MAVAFRKINPYRANQDDWTLYVELLGHVLESNGITDDTQKHATLLAVIGDNTYKLLSSLLAPAKPGDKPYTQLVETLTAHFDPAPLEIMERFKFNTRVHKSSESIATYVSDRQEL